MTTSIPARRDRDDGEQARIFSGGNDHGTAFALIVNCSGRTDEAYRRFADTLLTYPVGLARYLAKKPDPYDADTWQTAFDMLPALAGVESEHLVSRLDGTETARGLLDDMAPETRGEVERIGAFADLIGQLSGLAISSHLCGAEKYAVVGLALTVGIGDGVEEFDGRLHTFTFEVSVEAVDGNLEVDYDVRRISARFTGDVQGLHKVFRKPSAEELDVLRASLHYLELTA
ncbi:hypothetical protein [Saccharothrix texasensis]|uniref:Uncharacterized protein n=1 Tax=Saccharothrix texasensis TaxID=103734 RepID=A0A3N1HD03_9PSEU|nr:hypothetical protein [Saccharothrix texasensis]ROP40383.1 hypothetical protein EDD40_5791 [Saccharothrix texasensis]